MSDARAPTAGSHSERGAFIGAAIVTAIVGAAIAADAWVMVALIVGVLGAAIVLALPHHVVVLTIGIEASELLIPEPSHQLRLFVLAALAVAGWRLLDRLWTGAREPWTILRGLTVAFCIVVLVTMVVRGVGFQALGGSQVGGLLYIRVLATAAFALSLPGIHLTDQQWGRALHTLCALSILPFLADLTAVFVRPLAPLVGAFFQLSPSVAGLVFGTTTDGTAFRWFSAQAVSTFLTLFVFLREDMQPGEKRRIGLRVVVGMLAAFAIASFSGHRLAIVNVVGLSAFVLLLDGRLTPRRAMTGLLVLAAFLALLGVVASDLPVPVQRAISWIPGVQVSAEAGRSASDSVTWRLAVWVLALQEVPKYLVIGRGIAFSRAEAAASSSAHLMSGEANWAIVQGYFHNGWLSLLILFGIAGLVIGFALLATAAARHVGLTRRAWRRPCLRRYHRVLTAWLILQIVSYWLIYGDVQVSFPLLFFTIAVLEALRSDDLAGEPPLNGCRSNCSR